MRVRNDRFSANHTIAISPNVSTANHAIVDMPSHVDMHAHNHVHKWITKMNAVFAVLHSIITIGMLLSPLLVTSAAVSLLTIGLLALHPLLAGMMIMHQITINLSEDDIVYQVPGIMLVAPSRLIIVVNVICIIFNVLHVISTIGIAIGICPSEIVAGACLAARVPAILISVLSSVAIAINVGAIIFYGRVACENDDALPGIHEVIRQIPTNAMQTIASAPPRQTPRTRQLKVNLGHR